MREAEVPAGILSSREEMLEYKTRVKGHSPYTADVTPSSILNMAKALEAMGEYAERVEDPDEIAPALKRAFKVNRSGRPAYIEFICCKYPIFGRWLTT